MARSAKLKFKKEGVEVQGDLLVEENMEVLGTCTYTGGIALAGAISGDSLASTANTDVGADLDVVGATTLNGAVDLGDAAADDIRVLGSVASDVQFKTGAARAINGPASHDFTVAAPAGRQLILKSNAVDALVCGAAGAVTVPLGLTVTAGGATVSAGNLVVTMGDLSVAAGNASIAGNLAKNAANGAALTLKVVETEHTVVGGGATETLNNLIPAGALVMGVCSRVTEGIVMGGGGVNFDIGVSGALTRYAENVLLALGTTTTLADAVAASSPIFYKTATNLLLTADAGTFTSGKLRVKVFYFDATAPTA